MWPQSSMRSPGAKASLPREKRLYFKTSDVTCECLDQIEIAGYMEERSSSAQPVVGLASLPLVCLEADLAELAACIKQHDRPPEGGGGRHDPAFDPHTLHGNAPLCLGHLQGCKDVAGVWQGPQAIQELPPVVVGGRPAAAMCFTPPDATVCISHATLFNRALPHR